MTDTTTEVESEKESKKTTVKEVPVVQDEGYFQHDTGDTYNGFFEAKKKDRSAKMHGPGVYTSAEGDSYTGFWEADKLGANDEVVISFVDGSRYQGSFKDWSYVSRGKYVYPDGSILECDFADNCPVGALHLLDPNGHTWLGKAEVGFGWLEPVNHFYDHLFEKTRRVSHVRKSNVGDDSPNSTAKTK